jgi:hypothetical protein
MAKETGEYSGAAAAAPVSTTYPRYNRGYFTVWATTMEWALKSNELWEAVDPGGDEYKKGAPKYRKDHHRNKKNYIKGRKHQEAPPTRSINPQNPHRDSNYCVTYVAITITTIVPPSTSLLYLHCKHQGRKWLLDNPQGGIAGPILKTQANSTSG